jgi:hypothetical protein
MMGSATAHKARFKTLVRDEFILLLLKRFSDNRRCAPSKGAKLPGATPLEPVGFPSRPQLRHRIGPTNELRRAR